MGNRTKISTETPIPAVARALRVLRYLSRRDDATFGQIVALLGVPHSTAARLLRTLQRLRYVFKHGRRYYLSHNIARRGPRYNPVGIEGIAPPSPEAHAVLERLALDCGQTVALHEPLGRMTTVLVDRVTVEGGLSSNIRLGAEWPLLPYHGWAQVFLAYRPPELVKELYDRWKDTGENRLLTFEQHEARLAQIRARGYNVEDREDHPHVVTITAPVFAEDPGDPVLVVGVSTVSVDAATRELMIAALKRAVAQLESFFAHPQTGC